MLRNRVSDLRNIPEQEVECQLSPAHTRPSQEVLMPLLRRRERCEKELKYVIAFAITLWQTHSSVWSAVRSQWLSVVNQCNFRIILFLVGGSIWSAQSLQSPECGRHYKSGEILSGKHKKENQQHDGYSLRRLVHMSYMIVTHYGG